MLRSSPLKDRTIALGVTGGIACYKALELLRLLTAQGAQVHVLMTEHAQRFVTPLSFETLSYHPVLTDMFAPAAEKTMKHIWLAEQAEMLVVAPATANILGKFAHGIADDLLSTFFITTRAPVLVAPAMNPAMYQHPRVQENIAKLRQQGVEIIEPEYGRLAGPGEGEGKGRLAAPERILARIEDRFCPKDWQGITVLVTAGPTREALDAVRFLSNPSSGKMGYAIAQAAQRRGARVVLISGPTHLSPPPAVECIRVTTAREMYDAVMAHLAESDVVIKAAAVSDFRPQTTAPHKLKKEEMTPTLLLERNPDILAEVGQRKGNKILVGFAAETEAFMANAWKKMERKNLDLVVVNDVGNRTIGFGSDENQVQILYRDRRQEELPRLPKSVLADLLLDRILPLLSHPSREGACPQIS
ncbi:MAG: bifunctional phosphopantothenoylcysteine decarboxylase/phosphopantothenate--cysteine ligase CoaBC [Nitrospinota bacterium]|nr:MAG: bifunctional phosphopantothenoylcysteine decarboxylase/phosphopantothenate--cysteine ligase CoaBC [Nitrospinota bacterium]